MVALKDRKIIRRDCFLCKKRVCKQFDMLPSAPLPDFRVQLQNPFCNTGVDYIGPLYVYPTPERKLITIKLTLCYSLVLLPELYT